MVKMCGAKPVVLETVADNDYIVDAQSLRDVLEAYPRSKAIILCNPSNPTGIDNIKYEKFHMISYQRSLLILF